MGKDQHDPCVQLRQGLGHKLLAGLREDGANEPQVEGIGGQGEDIWIGLCSFLERQARTVFTTRPFIIVGAHAVNTALYMINIEASINITKRKWRRKEEVKGG